MPVTMRRSCSMLAACLVVACSSESDDDTVTLHPLEPELVETREPQDAIRRFEAQYQVKAGTGRYRIYAIGGRYNDCFPLQGTELGVEVVHASREDTNAIYCYDDTGQFTLRL